MAHIELYTTPICPFCHRAKQLLQRKGASYDEHNVMLNPGRRAEMRTRSGGANTVPQIFIDGQHIGGCDELYALDARGGLDPLLQAAS
ncbi:glutaredoxin 3 [Roseospira marina]|uniref:Glutaredoxin n=1 Tax=Roseospira marina TaxID=140057 RepID=A0A5M6I9I4_9PROT|nr:glutaredoxin 3 [Roseospira marina]KAA5604890.1 glutaredoxin 3 [Roseospira marina]MBB4315229.1 glutaredoxin 3 [Roseospira marina]MBB5088229.1 glutaredoxin 3 [Roseospira marina]